MSGMEARSRSHLQSDHDGVWVHHPNDWFGRFFKAEFSVTKDFMRPKDNPRHRRAVIPPNPVVPDGKKFAEGLRDQGIDMVGVISGRFGWLRKSAVKGLARAGLQEIFPPDSLIVKSNEAEKAAAFVERATPNEPNGLLDDRPYYIGGELVTLLQSQASEDDHYGVLIGVPAHVRPDEQIDRFRHELRSRQRIGDLPGVREITPTENGLLVVGEGFTVGAVALQPYSHPNAAANYASQLQEFPHAA